MIEPVRCLVWDLDDTLWAGTLVEGDDVALRPRARDVVTELDRRGVLQSVASVSDPAFAADKLDELGLGEMFLCPQIALDASKADQLAAIMATLALRPEHTAFIDDSPFQRELVAWAHPAVRVHDAAALPALLDHPDFCVPHVTAEASRRRVMVRADLDRAAAAATWDGDRQAFLRHCDLRVTLAPVAAEDLDRVAELAARTNRLNASSRRLSRDELDTARIDPGTWLLAARLNDRFGDQGLVGVLLVDLRAGRVETLLVSCRVMGRGVGEVLLRRSMRRAAGEGWPSLAVRMHRTPLNQPMQVLFAGHGFLVEAEDGPAVTLRWTPDRAPDYPPWLSVEEL